MSFRAVIMAGGSGERFWPLSTPEKPKQFLATFGGESLIRQAVARLAGVVEAKDVFVVTAASLVNLTRRELPELPPGNIVGEPLRRDTGAAVALGVGVAGLTDDTVLGFFPADHLVTKPAAFRATLRKAIRLAADPSRKPIVTLGVMPTFPATSFGYVNPVNGAFQEKPDATTARRYIKKGYLWNAGMFIARVDAFRAAFASCAPALCVLASERRPSARRLPGLYAALPRISFDYAVMEKLAGGCVVVPTDCGWDDVGGYLAFDRYFRHDAQGNVMEGDCSAVDATDNVIVARQGRIAVLGAKNLVIVSSPAGILVADKAHLDDMKKLLAQDK